MEKEKRERQVEKLPAYEPPNVLSLGEAEILEELGPARAHLHSVPDGHHFFEVGPLGDE